MEPYISVIIPIYNSERYLVACLESVLSQSLQNIEIICIDDGSTDSSLSLLKKYELENENILVLHQDNQGAAVARNLGIQYAHGKYIGFMDSDDHYPDSEVLRKLYETAEKECVLICGGNLMTFDGKSPYSYWFEKKEKWNYEDFQESYYFQKYIYNTKLLKDNNIAFPGYRMFEDPPFLVKAMICAKNFYALNDIVYVYRTSYKEIDYSLEKVVDLLRGIKEVCEYAKANHLNKLYRTTMGYIIEDFRELIYKYAYYGIESIWIELNTINAMVEEDEIEKISPDTINKYVLMCKQEKELLWKKCKLYEKIIVYGAGKVAIYILRCLSQAGIKIEGIAVTKKTDKDMLDGYKIREIEEYFPYKKDSLVLVATGIKYQKEIEKKLLELNFANTLIVDYKKIRFIENL